MCHMLAPETKASTTGMNGESCESATSFQGHRRTTGEEARDGLAPIGGTCRGVTSVRQRRGLRNLFSAPICLSVPV